MGRMEILTGVERRRDWSDDEKRSILQEAAEPNARIADVARRHDVKPQQIYAWRRKFAAEQSEPVVSFLPVALIATETNDEAERPAPALTPRAAAEPDAEDEKLRELVAFMAKGLVDHPDDVEVEILRAGADASFELRVHPDDIGHVIGKQGRTARSLRLKRNR